MKNRLILILLVAFTLTACTKDMSTTNNNSQVDNNNNTYDDNVYDDEIVDFDQDYDYQEEPDDVPSVLINCKDCVFAFYKDKKTVVLKKVKPIAQKEQLMAALSNIMLVY